MLQLIYTIEDLKVKTRPALLERAVDKAWVFGSYARGEATADSDVDIMIQGGNMKGIFALGGLYGDLEEALGKQIDLVELDAILQRKEHDDIEADMIKNIERDKVLIYEK